MLKKEQNLKLHLNNSKSTKFINSRRSTVNVPQYSLLKDRKFYKNMKSDIIQFHPENENLMKQPIHTPLIKKEKTQKKQSKTKSLSKTKEAAIISESQGLRNLNINLQKIKNLSKDNTNQSLIKKLFREVALNQARTSSAKIFQINEKKSEEMKKYLQIKNSKDMCLQNSKLNFTSRKNTNNNLNLPLKHSMKDLKNNKQESERPKIVRMIHKTQMKSQNLNQRINEWEQTIKKIRKQMTRYKNKNNNKNCQFVISRINTAEEGIGKKMRKIEKHQHQLQIQRDSAKLSKGQATPKDLQIQLKKQKYFKTPKHEMIFDPWSTTDLKNEECVELCHL